jgi:hypothetical protein
MRHSRDLWMKTRGGWRETPQAHEIEVRDVTEMSDEKLIVGTGRWRTIPLAAEHHWRQSEKNLRTRTSKPFRNLFRKKI